MIPEWTAVGIPDGYGPCKLLYNPPSGMVIVELRSTGEEFLPNQIYLRHKDEHTYRPVRDLQPMVSSESVATSLDSPRLFYISNKLVRREQHHAGEWDGLYQFDIQTGATVRLACQSSLLLPRVGLTISCPRPVMRAICI